jgi:GSCFA family
MKVEFGKTQSVDAALQRFDADKDASRWPSRDGRNRLEPIFVPRLRPRFRIDRNAAVFTIGSCFARNIEEFLAHEGMRVPMLDFAVPETEWPYRPNGILNKFAPPNMLQEVRRAALSGIDWQKVDAESERLLFPAGDDLVIDLELFGFIPVRRERAMERRRQVHETFRQAFDSDVIVITMGLIECWFDNATGLAIDSTPVSPALLRAKSRFGFRVLDVAEAYRAMRAMIEILTENGRPDKKILVTVSPVPLYATFTGMDVVVANCFGKSTLRTVAQQLFNDFECVDYFPSYEMVIYSKDPDTWEDDLIHVTDAFVEKVVRTMLETYL